ncbi:MAG: rod shape-determining protein MreC [Lachnospiraceae bacterium]|nr:rod shape-determining protein MreC [Lachnospiraceae bacterium]
MLRFWKRKIKPADSFLSFIRPKYILYALGLVCLLLMFLSLRLPSFLMPLRNAVSFVAVPMQKGINRVGSAMSDRISLFAEVKALQEENAALKERMEELESLNSQLALEKYELDELRALYRLDAKYPDYKKVAAHVIAREGNGWYSVFTLDKGSNDGIEENMNVISGNGLVGIVTSVRSNSSTVRTIIDDSSGVSGMNLRSGDTCIINGDLSLMTTKGLINVSMISVDSDIRENEEIVTSYISDRYLSGILIGYIKDITMDAGNLSKNAYLIPAVDFEHISEVLIITTLKESYDLGE